MSDLQLCAVTIMTLAAEPVLMTRSASWAVQQQLLGTCAVCTADRIAHVADGLPVFMSAALPMRSNSI